VVNRSFQIGPYIEIITQSCDAKADLEEYIHTQVETELNRWRYALRCP